MKRLNSLALAIGLIAAPAAAIAQSSPSPDNHSGPGVSPSVEAPTDMGLGNESGNGAGIPQRLNGSGLQMRETTGSGYAEPYPEYYGLAPPADSRSQGYIRR
jgi:hypothetical protein